MVDTCGVAAFTFFLSLYIVPPNLAPRTPGPLALLAVLDTQAKALRHLKINMLRGISGLASENPALPLTKRLWPSMVGYDVLNHADCPVSRASALLRA